MYQRQMFIFLSSVVSLHQPIGVQIIVDTYRLQIQDVGIGKLIIAER